ncbi:hypothetical protein D3C86_1779390 [compost metagenome]
MAQDVDVATVRRRRQNLPQTHELVARVFHSLDDVDPGFVRDHYLIPDALQAAVTGRLLLLRARHDALGDFPGGRDVHSVETESVHVSPDAE